MINIPYGKQSITSEDIDSVINVLKSDFLTQGNKVPEFEKIISDYVGSSYCVATNSATSSLHLACLAMGITKESRVWTSPNTFVATSNSALYCGATIDFIDISMSNYNMCLSSLEKKLIKAKKDNKLPDLVIPVHLTGNSCDMLKIHDLSKEYGFKILEDASHCIGGDYNDKKIGSCVYSDACVFSFHPVKIITTGEGGAITTNNQEIYKKIIKLRSHGIQRENSEFEIKETISWYYEQQDLGFNYRLTDIQAALGISQIKRVDSFVNRRNEIARIYDQKISNKNIIKPNPSFFSGSAFHLYVVRVKKNRDKLRNYLLSKSISTNLHYYPVHLQPFYQKLGFKQGMFMNAEEYGLTALSIPIYPDMSSQQIDYVIDCINSFDDV